MSSAAITFKENDILDTFSEQITKIFSRSDIILKVGTQVSVFRYESTSVDETPLPYISLRMTSSSANDRYAVGNESEIATDFVLSCEIYSDNLERLNKQRAVALIGEILSSELRGVYRCLKVISNIPLPTKTDTARKLIKFSGVCDNKHNFIYSN